MPTIFSKCYECNHHSYLPPEHNDNENLEKMEILKEYGFPTEIAIKIIEMTHTYHKCDYCPNILCNIHKSHALRYGGAWPYIKCDQCIWDEIT